MNIKILYENDDILVVDKPAGVIVFPESNIKEKTLIDYLVEKNSKLKSAGSSPRYGIVHRLDKDTSGILLVAKTNQALFFLQKQFKNRTIQKKYLALVIGEVKENKGSIETLIDRSPKDRKKQKAFLSGEPGSEGKRQAITEYKVLEKYEGYTLLEVIPKTGRKHQIRCHLAYIHHPIAVDKVYGFKNPPVPEGLTRHFLHASYLKFETPNGEIKEIKSELPEDLNKIIKDLKSKNYE
ncbi:RluA family pseudouridine synthase [Patescibacteria group bacterium]|nr:RluA family pseudouridine synthase [Patescibacteria group bacterium]MBU4367298.1 RluA family pseudouridine synthase [Patescibacteria group bacterium]MBU4461635.1 RluA family pseudouridine synthase [Patescibacteria group bacterium]MCG2699685.1 RluA family pseudouridine synthase [Candidatus Parcubacteria bacterium]